VLQHDLKLNLFGILAMVVHLHPCSPSDYVCKL